MTNPIYLLDTHCHIDQYSDPVSIVRSLDHTRVIVIAVTTAPSVFQRLHHQFAKEIHLRLALGIHPLLANKIVEGEWSIFQRCLPLTRFISEIGLDFSPVGTATKQVQQQVFERILGMVKGKDKILSIHSRQAEATVLDTLQKYSARPAIFHWYSGNLTTLEAVIKAGHYCSVNPAMIVSNKGQKIIEKLPRNRILVETDGPYIKASNGKPVSPSNVELVYSYLNKIWAESYEATTQQVYTNFLTLLGVE